MEKMKKVSPHSLEGDLGWQLRDAYSDAMREFETSVLIGGKILSVFNLECLGFGF